MKLHHICKHVQIKLQNKYMYQLSISDFTDEALACGPLFLFPNVCGI